jgi:hypothetical protein
MSIRLLFGVAVLISATLAANPLALSEDADPGPIDNTHGAPLLIIRDHHTLTLQNRTEKSVQSYRLGCFRSNQLSIERRFPLEQAAIPPSSTVRVPIVHYAPDQLTTCHKLRAKLTVLETTFADGTAWHLSDAFSQSSNVGLPTATSAPDQNLNYIDNSPGAPLTLAAQGTSLTIHNSTNETIQSYQLACIRNQPHIQILHRFRPQQSLMQPAAGIWQGSFDSPPDEITKCQNLSAKLTVLQATFGDGTTWHLPEPSSTKK